MRRSTCINDDWFFLKDNLPLADIDAGKMERIDLPHTWNNVDGQDGGNDYYRGTCVYYKKIKIYISKNEAAYLEFNGVAMTAKVYFNGRELFTHKGGYSRFRVNVTEHLSVAGENDLVVYVDNGRNREIYPQRADFTFYGGIFRDVNLIITGKNHFALDYYGSNGVKITPSVDGNVHVECFFNQAIRDVLKVCIFDGGKVVSEKEVTVNGDRCSLDLRVENVRLWDGVEDPHLYTLVASISDDEVSARFGFRSFAIDPERGFLLNGREYPLIGVSRHQDRFGVGSAITKEMHREDLEMIFEMGANTIRLAHYQHDQYVYDLCDEMGFLVWAEIPYISEHMEEAVDNIFTQMTELIVQNYNHPSIYCWGLSNEITVVGGETEEIIDVHRKLNELCHRLDATRVTTIANLFTLDTDSELNRIPDVRAYNLYFGWYVGDYSETGKWLDEFHRKYPSLGIGISEYGADANVQFQTSSPIRGDYSESYQALYHENMLKMRETRPYIWVMYVWNMFDFASDARDEGGKKGINQKGLVSFDRKIKKDAFYIYKAYLSREPFVHISGRRYRKRNESRTEVKIYSNLKEISLYVDGMFVERKEGNKVFVFDIEISGVHTVKAVSGPYWDEIEIEYSEISNEEYVCDKRMEIINWFEIDLIERKEGYYSVFDSVYEIKKNEASRNIYENWMAKILAPLGGIAKETKLSDDLQERLDKMTLKDHLKMMGRLVSEETIYNLNEELNKIKKTI